MTKYEILKRQFTADGGAEDKLNESVYTSKYMRSYKYCIRKDGQFLSSTFKTKKEAQEYINNLRISAKQLGSRGGKESAKKRFKGKTKKEKSELMRKVRYGTKLIKKSYKNIEIYLKKIGQLQD